MLAFLCPLAVIPLALSRSIPSEEARVHIKGACHDIAATVSKASAVFYPGSPDYALDIEHWVPNAEEKAVCSVEPGSVEDVSTIIKILAKTDVPFGIKSGGHMAAKGYSSTTGVHISLNRLNQTVYNKAAGTVDIQPGQAWNDVYAVLEPLGINVLGGRLHGVGVGGFLLGGGYSWLSNEYGLAIDNISRYELVRPNGDIVTVTAKSYPDLFFGLKGGFNNFGIVTRFTMTAIPQGKVWGGTSTLTPDAVPGLIKAVADFQRNATDPKAQVIAAIQGHDGIVTTAMILFYNAEQPPSGLFEPFLSLPYSTVDISTRSFPSLVEAVSPELLNLNRQRGAQDTAPLADLTEGIVQEVTNQAQKYSSFAPGSIASFSVEPFLTQSVTRPDISATAWPHAKFLSPLSTFFFWTNTTDDDVGLQSMLSSSAAIQGAAISEHQVLDDLSIYANYVHGGADVTTIYGANLNRLRALAKLYDPHGVMKRASGFKF